MKKIKYLIFSFILLIPFSIYASYDAYIKGTSVRIRTGPSTDYSVLSVVNNNTDIIVEDETLIEGKGCSEKWYKIQYNNKEGYVCSKYVVFNEQKYKGMSIVDYTSRVSGNNVSVRKSTSTNSSVIDTLSLGVNVEILDTVNGSSSNCSSGKWHKIQYYGTKSGYICSNYVISKKDITDDNIDEDYKNYLNSEGFPDSYIPYLNYLHKKYPTWVFKAGKTNKDFAKVVSFEEGKNYMQTTNDNYRTSTTPAEGSSWFYVNSSVIAFYMDPRNWLYENRIFMFENLGYDDTLENQYKDLAKSIFGNGKLSDDMYIIPMVNAGKTNKISPVHIASRIKQEVSANGSDSTNGTEFTWKDEKYSGYYNFFNIGAYEVTIDGVKYSAVTRGLAYAAKLIDRSGSKWDNIETAITEGSSFLANGYINLGQGTLYYQKFNVGPDAYYSSYTHQYMTNIQAPATEGSSAYTSYKNADTLNNTFVFEIPVYTNMPNYTSLPTSANTNNDLKSLEIEGYSLTPSFDEDVLSYETYISKDVEKIKINAIAKESTSTITGNGEIIIEEDESLQTITVTSESGDDKKYTISIHRINDTTTVEDVVNKMNATIKDEIILNISSGTNVGDYKNNIIKNGATSVLIKDGNNELKDSDNLKTNITVTITTAIDTKTYVICVKGDTSGDGNITILDLLQVQKHLQGTKLSGAKFYAADTSGDRNVTILDLLQIQKKLKGEKDF